MQITGNKILCIGDSITYDTVSPTEGAYRYYLGPKIKTYFRTNSLRWCGDNSAVGRQQGGNKMIGASGQRVDEINTLYDVANQMLRWNPDLVVIHLGTNDMTQMTSGTWPTGTIDISISEYSTLLDTIFADNPNRLVAACKIIPNTGSADSNITLWNAALETMITSHEYSSQIFIPDCNAAFKANATWAADYMFDATHPNSTGKAIIADAIYSSMVANIERPLRFPARQRLIKPFTGSLKYTASTGTILGTQNTLDTTLPWAVSFEFNLMNGKYLTTNQGFLCLKTDQGHPFIFLGLRGTNQRYIEFGGWTSSPFGRFFANVNSEVNLFDRLFSGWHQLTFTFDGVSRSAGSSYRFYIDGFPVNITTGSGLASSTNQNGIGVSVAGGVGGTFHMANLAIWNGGTVMTARQVEDFYLNNEMPEGPILIRHYEHDDESGSVLTDSTGNQNGAIGTAVWTTKVPNKARTESAARLEAQARLEAV